MARCLILGLYETLTPRITRLAFTLALVSPVLFTPPPWNWHSLCQTIFPVCVLKLRSFNCLVPKLCLAKAAKLLQFSNSDTNPSHLAPIAHSTLGLIMITFAHWQPVFCAPSAACCQSSMIVRQWSNTVHVLVRNRHFYHWSACYNVFSVKAAAIVNLLRFRYTPKPAETAMVSVFPETHKPSLEGFGRFCRISVYSETVTSW